MCDGKETVGCNGKREEQADMEHEKKDIRRKMQYIQMCIRDSLIGGQ